MVDSGWGGVECCVDTGVYGREREKRENRQQDQRD